MARLTFENVSKTFPGGVRAVDGASLEIGDGEFIVLVGPSGSGKSTLLRLTAGLEWLTGGTIRFDGRRVDGLPPRRRDVTMAFQTPALYPHLSVRENMAFPLRMRKVAVAERGKRVAETAEPLRIAGLLDRRPNELSGGERQRVALGRALVREANCLLLDEPFAHLDGPLREQVRLDLLEIHRRRPVTTLCVTHDQNDALLLGHRVAVMAAGRLQQVGPPLEIYDAPANRFVAGFFGSPSMQFLEGRLQSAAMGQQKPDANGLWFVTETVRLRVPQAMAARLGRHIGQSVQLGLRPEGIRLAEGNVARSPSPPAPLPRRGEGRLGGDPEFSFEATVRVSEVLGDRVFHRIELPDGQMLTVAGTRQAQTLAEGLHAFQVGPAAVQFFAPGPFGERL